jgi:glutaredoxin-like protein NrdH
MNGDSVMPSEIIMYSAEMCGDCQQLKAFMDANGIAYENRDIKKDPDHAEVLEQRTGKLGVPYLVINGEWVRGYAPGQPFSDNFARDLLGLSD